MFLFAPLLLAQAATAPDGATTPMGILYSVLLTVLTLAVTIAAGMVSKWLNAKAETSKLATVGFQVWEGATSIVAHLETTLRARLGDALKDGKLSAAEKDSIKKEAMRELKAWLGEDGLARLMKVFGASEAAMDTYLSGVIERTLGVQRASGTLPVPTAGVLPINKLGPPPPGATAPLIPRP